jgi:hypothetical protein
MVLRVNSTALSFSNRAGRAIAELDPCCKVKARSCQFKDIWKVLMEQIENSRHKILSYDDFVAKFGKNKELLFTCNDAW